MKKFAAFLFILWALLPTACQTADRLTEPPEIVYGQDVCEACSMIISDPRYAAAYVTIDEEIRLFDDIGDMLAYDAAHQEAVHVYWVHDFNTEAWVKAGDATFVVSDGVLSPMGWGVAAFESAAAADQFQMTQKGSTSTFAALQQAVGGGAIDPDQLHDHVHHEANDARDPTHDPAMEDGDDADASMTGAMTHEHAMETADE